MFKFGIMDLILIMGSCHCSASNEISSIKVLQNNARKVDRHLTLAEQISKLNFPNLPQKILDREINEIKLEQGSFMITKKMITIEGAPSGLQIPYEEKLVQVDGTETQANILQKLKMWVSCKKGLKTDPNQDDFVVIVDDYNFLIGVFDGHGIFGHYISDFVHKELPKLLFEHPCWQDSPEKVLKESFVKCHSNLIRFSNQKNSNFDCNMSGTTSTVVFKRQDRLFVAHVGDSRVIIGRKTDDGVIPVVLTQDHKPDLEKEKERIEAAGGEVRKMPGGPSRVYLKGKEYPGISMTRAIGDLVSQGIGIVSAPDTREFLLTEDDLFIIMASDGVWEFIPDEEAVRVASTSTDAKEAASRLTALAWTKWISIEENVVDDITVIITYLV